MKLLTTFVFIWALLYSFTCGNVEHEAQLTRFCGTANSCINGVSNANDANVDENVNSVDGDENASNVEGVGDADDVEGIDNANDVDKPLLKMITLNNLDRASFCRLSATCIDIGEKIERIENISPIRGGSSISIASFCSLLDSCIFAQTNTTTGDQQLQNGDKQTCVDMTVCLEEAAADDTDSGCCSSCSCMEDCGSSTDSCCQSKNDLFDSAENDIMACVPLFLGGVQVEFYMVTECLNGQTCYNFNDDVLKPDFDDDALQPVSSAATKRIYANRKCANCNGVTDFEYWRRAVHCNGNVVGLQHFPDHLQGSPVCYYHWLPPVREDLLWYNNFYCDVVHMCNGTSVDQSIQDRCYNNWAPVLYLNDMAFDFNATVFANEDCAICNGLPVIPYRQCRQIYRLIYSIFSSQIQVYLNMPVVSKYYEESSKHVDNATLGCVNSKETGPRKETCRKRLCPEGMVVVEGVCQYHILEMEDTVWSAQIRLLPVEELSKDYLSQVIQRLHVRRGIGGWLHRSCKLALTPGTKVFVTTTPQGNVEHLIIRVIQEVTDRNFEDEVELVRECLQGQWYIRFSGKDDYFTAILDTYKEYVPGEELLNIRATDKEVTVFQEETNPGKDMTNFVSVFIKKVNFCNQVELTSDETELAFRHIRMLHNNVVLGDNSYSLIRYGKYNENRIIRVCEADYLQTMHDSTEATVTTSTPVKPTDAGDVHANHDTTTATENADATDKPVDDDNYLQEDTFPNGVEEPLSNTASQQYIFWKWLWCIVGFGLGIKTIL